MKMRSQHWHNFSHDLQLPFWRPNKTQRTFMEVHYSVRKIWCVKMSGFPSFVSPWGPQSRFHHYAGAQACQHHSNSTSPAGFYPCSPPHGTVAGGLRPPVQSLHHTPYQRTINSQSLESGYDLGCAKRKGRGRDTSSFDATIFVTPGPSLLMQGLWKCGGTFLACRALRLGLLCWIAESCGEYSLRLRAIDEDVVIMGLECI
jgi:hypothetical protein